VSLTLLPAVDVAGGQAVRLVQGAAGSATSYGDPLQAALAWQEAGAQWIHLVDLDAAFGRGSNAGLLADVVGRLDVAVELSGGIRDDASLAAALATGCARVNIGTAALERPEWVRAVIAECGEKVAVGLDVRGDRLAARGWTREGGDLGETLARLDADGCTRFVVTDVTRDGTLTGPNLDLLRRVCAGTGRPVPAHTRRSRSRLGPVSVPSRVTSVTTKRVQPSASSRARVSPRSPPSRVHPRAASRSPRTSSPTATFSPHSAITARTHSGRSSAAVPMLTRAQPVASAAASEASSRMPPDSSTATSSLPTTSASSPALEPRPNAASRSTRWIHCAPASCQASAAWSGSP